MDVYISEPRLTRPSARARLQIGEIHVTQPAFSLLVHTIFFIRGTIAAVVSHRGRMRPLGETHGFYDGVSLSERFSFARAGRNVQRVLFPHLQRRHARAVDEVRDVNASLVVVQDVATI